MCVCVHVPICVCDTHLNSGTLQEVFTKPVPVLQEHSVHKPPSNTHTVHQEWLDCLIPVGSRASVR